MEPLEKVNRGEYEYEFEMNELSSQTPVGWSSICLDQTIHYYIDYNSTHIDEEKHTENISKDL